MLKATTLLLVEDQRLLRIGLKMSLERLNRYQIVGEAEDGEAAVKETQRLHPEVVLMDIGLPRMDGIEATWKIKQELPHTRIVMFTSHTSPDDVTAALGSGAEGYCAKEASVEQIAMAIDTVMRGEVWLDPSLAERVVSSQNAGNGKAGVALTDKDLQVLTLIKEGKTNLEIAQRLHTSAEAIAVVMYNIIQRFVAPTPDVDATVQSPKQRLANEWFAATFGDLKKEKIFVDKYLVQHLVGSGGMGAVFKAKHLYIERDVALKLLRSDLTEDPKSMQDFQREAKAIANLQHPNIVTIYDFGISPNNEPYLVMEFIAGQDLGSMLANEKPLSVRRLVGLCLQICAGLVAAHSKGIVHCDLKPSNILISGFEPNETVTLVDFGLAQIVPREMTSQAETTHKFLACGTPLYMSPEQSLGKAVDQRSDIYALGCLMFECFTGVNPFRGETVMETFSRQIHMMPPLMNSVYPAGRFPPDLIALVEHLLAKEPAARPQSMEEVSQRLLLVLEQIE